MVTSFLPREERASESACVARKPSHHHGRTDEPAPSERSGICDHESAHWTDEARAWGHRSLAPFNRPALLLLLCLPQGCGHKLVYMLAVGPWGRLIDHVRQTGGKYESQRGSEFDSANLGGRGKLGECGSIDERQIVSGNFESQSIIS